MGSHLHERWSGNIQLIETWIKEVESSFPVLTQWCKDTKIFLDQDETLGGAANLISSASLNHLRPTLYNYQADELKEKDLKNQIQECLNSADYCLTPNYWGEAHTRVRGLKNIKSKLSEKSVISIRKTVEDRQTESGQPIWNEVLYETTHTSEEDVLRDLVTLPRFFREMSLLFRTKNLAEGLDISNRLSNVLESARGINYFDVGPDRTDPITKSKMMSLANSLLPFGSHLGLLGQHLALLKPGVYQPCTASQYMANPKKLIEFKISSEGERMTEANVFVAPDQQKAFSIELAKILKQEEVLRKEGDLAALFEGGSPVGIDFKNNEVKIRYVEDVINVLHTVANTPSIQINNALDRVLLKKTLDTKSCKSLKKPYTL